MQIVAKKRLLFKRSIIEEHPILHERLEKVFETFKVGPSMRVQQAPDWIIQDGLFALAVSDGSIVVIGEMPTLPVAQPIPEPIPESQEIATQSTADESWLEKPLTELIGEVPQQTRYPTTSKGWPSANSI